MKNENELRELDAFCIEHVMGFTKALKMSQIEKSGQFVIQGEEIYIHDRGNYVKTFNPTTNPAAAMLVLEKCAEKIEDTKQELDCVQIQFWNSAWHVVNFESDIPTQTADTLPLAICKFAKELFK